MLGIEGHIKKLEFRNGVDWIPKDQRSKRLGTPPLGNWAEIEGIFTHFATAVKTDDRKFQAQYQFFKKY